MHNMRYVLCANYKKTYIYGTPLQMTNYVYLPYLAFVVNSLEIDPDHCKYIHDK